jgi:hypothetical protein
MPLVWRIPILALVASVACAQHAKQLARGATRGVKYELAQIDPAIARTLGDQAARGAVTGALDELASLPSREAIDAMIAWTREEAARSIASAMRPNGVFQQLVDRTVANAVNSLTRDLAPDTALRDELATIAREVSTSAVHGARDAVGDVFAECAGVVDRRRCIDDRIRELARAAVRGAAVGIVDAARIPIFALVFATGALFTLLLVRIWRARSISRA